MIKRELTDQRLRKVPMAGQPAFKNIKKAIGLLRARRRTPALASNLGLCDGHGSFQTLARIQPPAIPQVKEFRQSGQRA